MININFINAEKVELVDALGNKVTNVGEFISPTVYLYFPNTFSKNDQDYYHFAITGSNVEISGVIGEVTTKQQYTKLFAGCTEITKADQLTLTATDLTESCYAGMFLNCSNLKTPPTIAATGLAIWCYSGMFAGCSTLSAAPALPATTLAPYCYYAMFYGCSKLSASPYLPAETLTSWCYNSMFYNCSDLARISCNFSDWSGNATSSWVTNVAANGEFNNSSVEEIYSNSTIPVGWQPDYSAIPLTFKSTGDTAVQINKTNLSYNKNNTGWVEYDLSYIQLSNGDTVAFSGTNEIVDAPFATSGTGTLKVYGSPHSLINWGELKPRCFASLFDGCTRIQDASKIVLSATTLVERCYNTMFYGCSKLTAAPQLPATTLAPICYSYMFWACNKLSTAPELPAKTLANYCYNGMFGGCPLTAAPQLPATTLADHCYYSMFHSCSNLSTAPLLPATTLAEWCYVNMFANCSNLTSIEVAFTGWTGASNATTDWVLNVASSGVFKKPADLPTYRGNNYIPQNWTVVDKS